MAHPDTIPPILDFTKSEAKRIWDEPRHQIDSLAKITKFASFVDYGTRPISEYRPSNIYDYLEHRKDTYGNSDATLNRYVAALSKVFKHYDDEYSTNITPRLKWKKEPLNRPRFFTETELTQLEGILKNCPNDWAWNFVVIALKSGMRKGEILGIGRTKSQVPKSQPYGLIADDYSSVHLYRTKNGTERVVPLHQDAVQALKELDSEPAKAFDHHKFYREWGRARDRIAPDDETFVFHVCRHTAATHLAIKKFNVVQIGGILGHLSQATTARYIQSNEEVNTQMINSL